MFSFRIKKVDCNNCQNRGKTDGLSQESFCSHCIHSDSWKQDLYVERPARFQKMVKALF